MTAMSYRQDASSLPTANRYVTIIALLTAACLLGDSMLYIVLPVYSNFFGLHSLWEVGVLLAVNRLVRLPLNPLLGWLYHKISKRAGILTAVSIAFLTTLSYGYLKGFWLLLLMRILWGAAWALLRLGGYLAVLEAASVNNRGKLVGTYNGLWGLGSLIGMLAGGLLADMIGISLMCTLLGLLTLCCLPLTLTYVPKHSNNSSSSSSHSSSSTENAHTNTNNYDMPTHFVKSNAQTLSNPFLRFDGKSHPLLKSDILLMLASALVVAIIFFGIYGSTLSKLAEDHPLPENEWFLSLGAASLAGVIQAIRWAWSPFLSPWFGKLSDGPQGRYPLFILTLAFGSLTFAFLPLQLPLAGWIPLILAAQLANTAVVTLMDAIAADTAAGSSQVTVMAAYTTAIDLGAALGPILGFAIISCWGLTPLYLMAAALLLLLSLTWGFTWHQKKRATHKWAAPCLLLDTKRESSKNNYK